MVALIACWELRCWPLFTLCYLGHPVLLLHCISIAPVAQTPLAALGFMDLGMVCARCAAPRLWSCWAGGANLCSLHARVVVRPRRSFFSFLLISPCSGYGTSLLLLGPLCCSALRLHSGPSHWSARPWTFAPKDRVEGTRRYVPFVCLPCFLPSVSEFSLGGVGRLSHLLPRRLSMLSTASAGESLETTSLHLWPLSTHGRF